MEFKARVIPINDNDKLLSFIEKKNIRLKSMYLKGGCTIFQIEKVKIIKNQDIGKFQHKSTSF